MGLAALTRYADDVDLDIDNNSSEGDLRPVTIGRENCMFVGSDNGGATAAVLHSLFATAKRHGLDRLACLRDVIARTSEHSHNRLEAPPVRLTGLCRRLSSPCLT